MRYIAATILSTLLALSPTKAQQMPSIVTTATFNNIGIDLTFAAAPDTATRIAVSWNPATSSLPWHTGHELSRVASNRFAGSVFWLTPNTSYAIRLSGTMLSRDTVITVTTRSDVFPQPQGTTYHVAVNGSDSRDGSSLAQAFATLGHAVSVANSGATILLHAGHYYEAVSLPRSGTAQAPICIRNAPGETAVLDGRDTAFHPSWSTSSAGADIYRTACTAVPQLAYRNGQHVFASPTLDDLTSNTWDMSEGFFADGSYLYVRFPGGRAPSAADTFQIPRYTTAITVSGRDYIQIKGMEICYYGLDEYPRGIYFDGASFNLVDSCFFHHSCIGVAFKRACRFNTVQNSSFTEAPIDTWNWSAVKEGTGYYEAGGVVVYGSSSANIGNVIRLNHFYHMFDGSHLYSEDEAGPTSNMDFHDNLIEYVNDDCAETDGAGTNCRIFNNTFRNFLTGVSVAPAAGGPTYIVRNLFTGWETHSGYVGYPVKFNVGSSLTIDWVYLYHNTCYTAIAGQPGFLFKQYSNWNNIISRNNIFAGTDYALESTSNQNPVDFDYDDLYTPASGRLIRWAGSAYTTIPAFYTATGQEQHGLNQNPKFIDPSSDFHLAAGSPLINGGVVIPGVNDGYFGDNPDIGKYEYGSESVTTPHHPRTPEPFSIFIYPRQVQGTLTMRISTGSPSRSAATLDLFEISGKPMFRAVIPPGRSVVSAASCRLVPGVYVARLAGDGKRFTQVLMIKQ
jgi:hypothetical protein